MEGDKPDGATGCESLHNLTLQAEKELSLIMSQCLCAQNLCQRAELQLKWKRRREYQRLGLHRMGH